MHHSVLHIAALIQIEDFAPRQNQLKLAIIWLSVHLFDFSLDLLLKFTVSFFTAAKQKVKSAILLL